MRLEVRFELKKPELPKDNKSIWISFLKNVLSNCADGQYFERYYDGTLPKDYSFSVLMPHPKFNGDVVELDDNMVKMIFSADNRGKTGLIFYAAFLEAKNKFFPLPNGNSMVLKTVSMKKEQEITANSVLFKTVVGGGLVVREHNPESNRDKFYTFNEKGFLDTLQMVLTNELRYAKFPEYLINNISISVVSCKKVLVKQYGIYVDTNVGVFEIKGSSDILNYLYQAGMGSKRSMGYGLLDIVTEEVK